MCSTACAADDREKPRTRRSSTLPAVTGLGVYRLCVWILLLALAIAPLSCDGYAHLTRVTTEFPRAEECGKCHVEIHEEWAASPHAGAYVSSRFRAATDDYAFGKCLGCHAPVPTLTAEAPHARDAFREEGVTCVSCHLEEARQSGPFEASGLIVPHPVNADPERYQDSRFCGRCHEGTLAEWRAAESEEKPSCQQCHMPEVTRKMTQATDWVSGMIVAFEDEHVLKRHTFVTVPREVKPAPITCELITSDGKTALRLHNALPHSLPPGDFGVRIVTLEATAVPGSTPAAGDPAEGGMLGRWELAREIETHVPAGEFRDWPVVLPPGARAVRIRASRAGRDGEKETELLNVEVAVP